YKKYSDDNLASIQDVMAAEQPGGDGENIGSLDKLQREFISLSTEKIIPLVKSGNENEATALGRNEGMRIINDLNNLTAKLKQDQETILTKDINRVVENNKRTGHVMLISTLAAAIAGIIIALLLSWKIIRPVRQMAAEAGSIAEGDFTGSGISVGSKDEIGKLAGIFNKMLFYLKDITTSLQEKTLVISQSSARLSGNAESIAAGASETAAAISRMTGNIDQVNTHMRQLAAASDQSAAYAREGSEGIKRVAGQMEAIRKASLTSEEAIHGLNQSSAQITQIVELITSIAGQTNLLALNAAIEAARAGENGLGFAVVAEEVRKLAEQSTSSAKEIYGLVNTIQQESQRAVQVMEQGASEIQAGTDVVLEVGGLFERIISSVQEFTAAIRYASEAGEDIFKSAQSITAVAEEQTASSEEVSVNIQEIAGMLAELEKLTHRFKSI
ncbi:MAG: methyl-accepting chemotaxis protein, partial [Actinobacteria bacterium]|nr:methyl-accepting chemotaxis protein [Actinomycetota bacterium]